MGNSKSSLHLCGGFKCVLIVGEPQQHVKYLHNELPFTEEKGQVEAN